MYKHFIIYIITILLVIQKTSSQSKYVSELTLGAKFGYNISRINFDDSVRQKLKYGYNGGLVIRYMSEKYLGIQLELIVTQKGWTEKIDSPNSYNKQLTYFELPLLTHFEIGGKTSKFQFNGGPYFSYLLRESKNISITDASLIQPYHNSKIDNNLDFGLCGGIGFIQKTSIGHFEIEARYSQSFGNIFKFNHYNNIVNSQNQVLSLNFTYLIKF